MKTKRLCAGFVIASLLLLGGTAFAELNTNDVVPAATLLLPYFEVGLDPTSGVTTLFSLNNASAAPQVAHVVVWSDLSVPVLDFNVFLTGYDVQTVNMRDVLVLGKLPVTAHRDKDPADTISPHGKAPYPVVPAWDSAVNQFPGCGLNLPLGDPALQAAFLAYVQKALTGKGTSAGGVVALPTRCYGVDYADNRARGYVTVDVVADCNLLFPADPTYFNGTVALRSNVLWGDYFYVDTVNKFAQGDALVHVEAASAVPPWDTVPFIGTGGVAVNAYVPGDYTFYGRYVGAAPPNTPAADQREPLGNAFGSRYLNGGAFTGGTNLVVWRDAKRSVNPFVCGAVPAPFPLGHREVIAFDEQENAIRLCQVTSPISPPPPAQRVCFPWEAQRVQVGVGDLQTPWPFGWLFLNLNYNTGAGTTLTLKNADVLTMQNFVTEVHSALGEFSVGYRSNERANAYWQQDPTIIPAIP